MRLIFILFLSFYLISPNLTGQSSQKTPDYKTLLEILDQQAREGKVKALRDLGSLLHKPELKSSILQILSERTFCSEDKIKISPDLNRDEFMDFYYTYRDSLNYSELLEVFYLNSIEEMTVEYKTKEIDQSEKDPETYLRSQINKIYLAIDKQAYDEVFGAVETVILEDKPEGYQFLLDLIKNSKIQKFKTKQKKALQLQVCQALSNYPDIEAVEHIFQLTRDGVFTIEEISPVLAKLTNVYFKHSKSTNELVEQYMTVFDSVGSLESVRQYGFDKMYDFKMDFFQEEVDYFGKILNQSTAFPWLQHNAYRSLIETEHPRSLFYLASQIYKLKGKNDQLNKQLLRKYHRALERLIQIKVGVKNKAGQFAFDDKGKSDQIYKKNNMVYWSKHYVDYEWDDNYQYFTNKYRAEEITQNYEKLFRRLNSRNDSVALQSFVQLTEGEAVKVIELAHKYRQLLRSYNSKLPNFQNRYLEQMVLLTSYCKKHNINYKLPKNLKPVVDELLAPLKPKERFALENTLLQKIQFEDITALEYIACLNESNQQFTYSIGRVLDYFYTNNWPKILSNDDHLRLYLKKASLFENIGVFGSCNYYLVKFNAEDSELQSRLNQLSRIETDEEILNNMAQLITEPIYEVAYSLNDFLEDPESFDKRDINVLPPPKLSDAKLVIDKIKKTEDVAVIRKIFIYLRLHPHIDMVPYLFDLINDKRVLIKREDIGISVGDFIIPIVEEVYDYSYESETDHPFNTEKWRQLWKKSGKDYERWVHIFFEEKLQSIKTPDTLSIEDVNMITEDPSYFNQYKSVCLEALQKVQPQRDIKKLRIEPKLQIKEDLKFFEGFSFNYKDLDDITKLFDVKLESVDQLLSYLEKKSTTFSFNEKGSFYNNLFRQPWMVQYINSKNANQDRVGFIKDVLNTYLDESDYLSEYEEQTTYLNIAQIENIGRSVEEKIQATMNLDLDDGARAKILEEIIANISYQDLGKVVHLLGELAANDPNMSNPFQFINKDFGLPIFQLKEEEFLNGFVEKHKSLSQEAFYTFYLNTFGVDFKDHKDRLDFDKIDRILQFDIVTPFLSRTGGQRDYFSYGLIKILELNFNTTLGFHNKLNENQTFYTFSSLKRAQAWRNYLKEKKLVRAKNSFPPSFSRTREER